MNEYSDDHLNVHIAFRKKICFVWLISSALLEMNIDFQFSTECEYYSVWKYKPNMNTNIFGSKIKNEYEYEYI